MKKIKLLAAFAGVMMLIATGCNGRAEVPKATETTVVQDTTAADKTKTETEAKTVENQMDGKLEEKKDMMIIVKSDDDGESYVFLVEDNALVKDVTAGDQVTVTFEGDIVENFDSLVAKEVVKK